MNVSNTGRLPASYTLSVANCSVSVRPMEARSLALEAGESRMVDPYFELYVEDANATDARWCWVTLFDAQVCALAGLACLVGISFRCKYWTC